GIQDAVRLSWQIASSLRNTRQTAYRIEVASSGAKLRAGKADLWDSGRVGNAATFDVAYGGKPLASRQRAWWRVTVWDSHGRTVTSAPAFWEMGLLSPGDWQAKWLAAEDAEMRSDREAGLLWVMAGTPPQGKTCQVRLAFTLDGDADVTLMTVAGTAYSAFIDGTPIDLPPASSNAFGQPGTVETRVALKAGQHVLAMAGVVKCAMMVRARLSDGRVVRFNDLAARASADAPAGWNRPGFDDASWQPVTKIDGVTQPLPGRGAFLLRRDFSAAGDVAQARLYVTALGAYEAYINGARVGDALLAPECMDFAKRVRYRVYDVTSMVRSGANAIGAMVGDGWYGSYAAPEGRFAFGDPPLRFIAQLEITHADGRVQTVASDGDWTISASPITMSEIYNGEDYD
ncbi:MAG: alpha-L-rhamnosidase N-terminal domain-containing protein, partial [Asticcacaulis sp.]|nr:alpha-L-rhamnosidase N-terminal domain-containing protein [Asticcacaulis sp.]